MQRVLMLAMAGLALVLGAAMNAVLAAEDDGSKITITSPKDGETVGDTFELKYELTRGAKANHAHVYLDGRYQKGFTGTFRGVSKGKHEIRVTGATEDHKGVAATHAIAVEVQ